MKRVKEQYNLAAEERDVKACTADLAYVAAQLPSKHAASQFLYEELGKVSMHILPEETDYLLIAGSES